MLFNKLFNHIKNNWYNYIIDMLFFVLLCTYLYFTIDLGANKYLFNGCNKTSQTRAQ